MPNQPLLTKEWRAAVEALPGERTASNENGDVEAQFYCHSVRRKFDFMLTRFGVAAGVRQCCSGVCQPLTNVSI